MARTPAFRCAMRQEEKVSDFLNANQESKRRLEINAGFWDEI